MGQKRLLQSLRVALIFSIWRPFCQVKFAWKSPAKIGQKSSKIHAVSVMGRVVRVHWQIMCYSVFAYSDKVNQSRLLFICYWLCIHWKCHIRDIYSQANILKVHIGIEVYTNACIYFLLFLIRKTCQMVFISKYK